MKIKARKCPLCKDLIFSRARHDFRNCSCGAIFVDGGFDYLRMGFTTKAVESFRRIKTVDVIVDATKEELYDDWNKKTDKFGLIKKGDDGYVE